MGLSRKKQTTLKVGEFSHKLSQTYYGGSPSAIGQTGELVLATGTNLNLARSNASAQSYVGLFYNPSGVDVNTKDRISTFLAGPNVVTLTNNSVNTNNLSINTDGSAGQTGDDYPYDTTDDWNEGDRLYISNAGVWVNSPANSGDAHYGVVLKVGTGYLVVLSYGVPSYWTNANA